VRVAFHRRFVKRQKKMQRNQQDALGERLLLFVENPFNPILENHKLHGEKEGCRSINITGNVRAVYEEIDDSSVLFLDIGTHHELYGT
jgi:addiction module RelE/StbE family toxin